MYRDFTISYTKLTILLGCILLILLSAGCSTVSSQDGAPRGNINVAKIPDAVPKVEAFSKYGNPRYYYINGKREYVLKTYKGYNKVGLASWYGTKFHGRLTSTRERYNVYAMTAASRDLPIPCYVRVTNLENDHSVIVRVNDRGPFVGNRILDLSYAAAKKLGYSNRGTALVRVTAIDPTVYWAQRKSTLEPESDRSMYFMQVAAFSSEQHAENYRQQIAALTNAPVYVKPSAGLFKVQVGPLAMQQTHELREKLASLGLNSAVHVIS